MREQLGVETRVALKAVKLLPYGPYTPEHISAEALRDLDLAVLAVKTSPDGFGKVTLIIENREETYIKQTISKKVRNARDK